MAPSGAARCWSAGTRLPAALTTWPTCRCPAATRPCANRPAWRWPTCGPPGIEWEPDLPPVEALCAEDRTVLQTQLEHKLNAPLTSSMGRLFDAASALIGVRQTATYEGQAAIELEALCRPARDRFLPIRAARCDHRPSTALAGAAGRLARRYSRSGPGSPLPQQHCAPGAGTVQIYPRRTRQLTWLR